MSRKQTEVIQINLHRSRVANAALAKYVEKEDKMVVLAQEPHTYGDKLTGKIPHAKAHVKAGTGRPRACIYTRGIETWQMGNFTNNDMVTIRMSSDQGNPMIVASVYMAAETEAPPQLLKSLVDYCKNENLPLVIGTDANSHNTAWGSTDDNDRGNQLLEFIIAEQLEWANRGNRPTFVTAVRKEVLDLTILNDQARGLINNWRVCDEDSKSDHKYIRFQLTKVQPEKVAFRLLRNANWDKFQRVLTLAKLPQGGEPQTKEELDIRTEQIAEAIIQALNAVCPVKTCKVIKGVGWWSPKLDQMKKEARRLLNKAERTRKQWDWYAYRSHASQYSKAIRKAKEESWRRFMESIESLPQMARIIKALRSDGSVQLSSVVSPQGTLTESPTETLQCMLQHHVPIEEERWEGNNWGTVWEEGDIDQITSPERMMEALKAFHSFKAPGPDEIPPMALKRIWETPLREQFRNIFKASLRLGHIPRSWKKGKGIFLPKPGKESYDRTKSFRMITLTSFPLKWLERLVLWHLERDKGTMLKLDQRQFGFRKGASTDTALHSLTRRIEKAMESNEYTLGVFMDIENAFPTTSRKGIMKALERLEVPGPILTWIHEGLRERQISAMLSGETVERTTGLGCPQGGILSPFLWNAVLDSFLNHTRRTPAFSQAYADDIVGLFRGIDPPTLVSQAQTFLNEAVRWGRENGLKFSEAKTEMVVFTRKFGWRANQKLKMYGQEIAHADKAKYLGITMDSKLTFAPHVREKAKKAKAICVQLNRMVSKTWGLTPAKIKWIYTAMIRPTIEYGCLTWIKVIKVDKHMAELQRVQRLACLAMTSARRSAPTAALEVMMDLRPIDLALKEKAIMTSIRLQQEGQWQTSRTNLARGSLRTHVDIINDLRREIKEIGMPWDAQKTILMGNPKYSIRVVDRSTAINDEAETTTEFRCYTDGSKLESGDAGAGALIQMGAKRTSMSLHLGQYATVFQAEVMAITIATEHLAQERIRGRTIEFYTDSQATIRALAQTWCKNKIVVDCARKLNELGSCNEIEIRWIPGHTNVDGNETADVLAKEGANTKIQGPTPFLPLATSTIRTGVREHFREKHKERWQSLTTCRQARGALRSPEARITKALNLLGRKEMWMITQVITGHCLLARHGALIRQVTNPKCPKCKREDETPEHYVGRCPYYAKERESILGETSTTIRAVFDKRNIKKLTQFLKKTNRFEEYANGLNAV